jgi:hypothetical protein
MQQITKSPQPLVASDGPPSYIFFDTETSQDLVVGRDAHGEIKKHVVNCVCYEKVCDLCYDQVLDTLCKNCKQPRRGEWFGDEAFDKFCKWLIEEKNEGSYIIAHNARGFDGQFLLNWMQNNAFPPDTILMRGLEIIMMKFSNMKLLDSLNFLPFPLSAFPKTLGFEAEKGTFPHLFNKEENYEYRGPLPPKDDYGTATMKPKQLAEFEKWFVSYSVVDGIVSWHYNIQYDYRYEAEAAVGREFVFKEALLQYCHLDVSILTRGCMKMRKLVMDEHDLDPFVCAPTIASLCMSVYLWVFTTRRSIHNKEAQQGLIN